jgi:hypothetical protein
MYGMRIVVWLALVALLGGTAAACSKDGGSGEGGGGGGGGGGETEVVELSQLNLRMQAPSSARVSELAGSVMVQGPGLVVAVREAAEFQPATAEAAAQEAEMYSPQNVQTETLADGWALTFDNSGSMGANYFVQVRRQIDGTAYWCETTASSQQQAQAALNACKSLTR